MAPLTGTVNQSGGLSPVSPSADELGRNAALHVRRVKQGVPSVHPLQGDEMRALRELKRSADSPFVFTSLPGIFYRREQRV